MTSEEIATSFKSATDMSWSANEHHLAAEFHDTAVFHGGYEPFMPSGSEAKARIAELESMIGDLNSPYHNLSSGLQQEHLSLLEQLNGNEASFERASSDASRRIDGNRLQELDRMSAKIDSDYYKGEHSAVLQAEHLNLIEAQSAQSNAFNAATAAPQSGESDV